MIDWFRYLWKKNGCEILNKTITQTQRETTCGNQLEVILKEKLFSFFVELGFKFITYNDNYYLR